MALQKKMHAGAEKTIFQKAHELRHRPTDAEAILWQYLKQKPSGFKFRRQHPYGIYILDFYCHQLKLVIEVDGSIHNEEENKIKDAERQANLEKDGLQVFRFTNNEVFQNPESLIQKLQAFIQNIKS